MGRFHPRITWRAVLTALFLYFMFLAGFALSGFSYAPAPVAAEPTPRDSALAARGGDILLLPAREKQPATLPELDLNAPAVIYCTHTSEEYAGQKRISGQAGGVLSAARALAEELERLGLETLLLEQVFDAPDWNRAYGNSLAALEQVKAQYPEAELFIDVHRDSPVQGLDTHYQDADGAFARMMLIIGSDANLEHPDWRRNRDFAYAVEAEIEAAHPGLMRDARLYSGRYNQHLGDKAFLVEIGSTENTVAEAENSARALAAAVVAALSRGE